ncbi:hypothetical protein VF14_27300 [Nostoc linckia z18]|uniref:DUF3352 domain-containing protein n=3 Tax=Nostoc linckia TaxID=92942 RepID=A0A9Q5Z6F2_NOSLI|nr:DUF3352 domain-containing protein [Nostoc linckia]PHK41502.1 hypothetical protein VF13_31185 [Nostoc linckia z16]PHJ68839.1 hypothetical protein VF03_24590 [Nostoc linckia z2]PHJ79560.1 hypothetical protein VF07_33505 [Nostoc linckia z6]PHJ81208.1 hypothetical protein VF06_20295 [Nostoc linckia z4]PHJ95805.1 hypothetical protein VF08_31520 [Nostoc linckia z8]
MAPPLVSVPMKKNQKPSLVLTLSSAGLLIAAGSAAYWLQRQPSWNDLLVGANIIPGDALFAVSLTTDPQQWQKLRELGTKETQGELDKNLVQWRDRFLTNNGYDFQKDIAPWVGNNITIAILAPQTTNKSVPKPVTTDADVTGDQQSMVMVLPVKNPEIAKTIFAQPKSLKQGQWVDRTYQGIAIKQNQGQSGENFSAALLDGRFLVITDSPKATERTIDAYKNQTSLVNTGGFAENFPKIANNQPFAQFYVNIPTAAKIAAASPNRPLPAQVLAQLQNNQGLGATMTLEPEGIRLKAVSWLNPNSQRVLAVENKAGGMQSRVPAETLMMLSGGNLQRSWAEYVLTSQGNPLSPIAPEQLRNGVKSITDLDLDKDLLSWMKGEFSLSLIPNTPKQGSPDNFRVGLLFMVQTSERKSAEASISKLDEVMSNQYQFQIQPGKVANQPVVNWISPYGTLTATHGWLDENIAFFVVGAPITDKILPKPNNTLANTLPFQQTVPTQLNPTNGQFYLDVERTAKNFPLPTLIPNQQTLLNATRSIGMTSAVSDSRSNRYDIFIALKKVGG